METQPQIPDPNALKRKRSPSLSSPGQLPQTKIQKTSNLQINYLARQSTHDLPLLNKSDTIPNILDVLSSYSSVLDRHESLASNLGARPLGPILIKRFERCFDGPPEVIASHSHSKDSVDSQTVSWLEVIQFAQSHPGQFTLSTFSEGRRVCQFYYPQKQIRLQVSEEDFLFIKSGRCQDLIPPLPIWEDEEKEIGTCEILEKQLRELTNAADAVAARTRQLSHRLKGRRMAIMERRAGAGDTKIDAEHDSVHEVSPDMAVPSPAAGSNFTAVNGHASAATSAPLESTATSSVRNELLKHFQSLSQNQSPAGYVRRQSFSAVSPTRAPNGTYPTPHEQDYTGQSYLHDTQSGAHAHRADQLSYHLAEPNPPPVAVPTRLPSNTTPSSQGKHNFSRPLAPSQEVSQPYRLVCQALMESLPRGARVMPPCDRCRRLKMDCLKNLTSCQGCTKKHARCHWKEVDRSEVEGLDRIVTSKAEGMSDDEDEDEGLAALQDLEALGRDEGSASSSASPAPPENKPAPPPPPEENRTPVFPAFTSVNSLPRALPAALPAAPPEPREVPPEPRETAPVAQPEPIVEDKKEEEKPVVEAKRDERQLSPFSALLARPPMEMDPRPRPEQMVEATPTAPPPAPAVAVGWRAV